jgi:hypothetical protein
MLLIGVVLLLTLTACSTLTDFENAQVLDDQALGYASADQRLGQTFILRRTPLTSIQIFARLAEGVENLDAQLTFDLYHAMDMTKPLYSGAISYQEVQKSYPLRIPIPSLGNAAGEVFYIEFSTTGAPIWFYGRQGDVYSAGQLYLDGAPQNADLAIRFTYRYDLSALLADLAGMVRSGWLFLPLVAALIGPGWFLLTITGLRDRFEILQMLPLALGLSLAFPAVILVWTSWLQIHLRPPWIMAIYSLMMAWGLVYEIRRWWKLRHSQARSQRGQQSGASEGKIIGLALAWLFFVVLFTRIAMVRDLSGPAWVDSVHHTLISRLIQSNGYLPATFEPYATTPAVNYHTGFHGLLAIFGWISGLRLIDSLMVLGQVLNAAIILPVYLLTYTLTHNRSAGWVAALIVGLLTPMPAYYTSWGRYTQLAGLILLPGAFLLIRSLWAPSVRNISDLDNQVDEKHGQPIFELLLAAMAFAGLFLIHIRVALFLVCLLLADFSVVYFRTNTFTRARIIPLLRSLLILTGITGLLLLPVVFPLITDLLPQRTSQWNQTGAEPIEISWRYLTAGPGNLSLVLAGLGLILGLVLNPRLSFTLFLWVGLMFFLSNVHQLGLPIRWLIGNDAVVISLFMPLAVSGGFFITSGLAAIRSRINRSAFYALAAILVAIGVWVSIWGAREIISILNPVTVFLRQDDRRAADWINSNLPEQASLLINPAPWGYGVFVGSDGGYWISPLTGRETFPPTLLYAHGSSQEIKTINVQVQQLMDISADPQAVWSFMQSHKLDYLYIGARGGPFRSGDFLEHPLFELIYTEGDVKIFKPRREG